MIMSIILGPQREKLLRLFLQYGLSRATDLDDYTIKKTLIDPPGSNDHYIVEIDDKQFEFRVSGKLLGGIDRTVEQHNLKLVNDAGITLPHLVFDPDNGVKISEYLDIYTFKQSDLLKEDLRDQALLQLSRLHDSGLIFRDSFSPLNAYTRLGGPDPLSQDAVRIADQIVKRLHRIGMDRLPCHQDACYKNFVVFRDEVYLSEWEHASMGDPYFDFADFCQQNALDHIDSLPKQCCTQFHHSRSFDAEKFILFYLLSMLTWGLWSVQKNRPAKSHELLTKAIHRSKNHI